MTDVLKTTCRSYLLEKTLEATKGHVFSPKLQKEIETRAMINAIVCYVDQYFPVQNDSGHEVKTSLRGRPRPVEQMMIDNQKMRECLEWYRSKDIASLADAKLGLDGKPWLDAPPLCDWSMAERCFQEIDCEDK